MGLDRPRTIMRNAQGGELAAPAFTAFMSEVYRRRALTADFAGPGGLVALPVDRLTGYRAGPLCPAERIYIDYFIAGTEPTQECDGSIIGPMGDSSGVRDVDPVTGKPRRPAAADTMNPFRLP
jgi:penicillin-binding protein 1A